MNRSKKENKTEYSRTVWQYQKGTPEEPRREWRINIENNNNNKTTFPIKEQDKNY